MGTSLYNKIPLGRSAVWESKRVQAALLASAVLGIGLAWFILRTFK